MKPPRGWALLVLGICMPIAAHAAELSLTCTIDASNASPGSDPIVGISVELGPHWSVVHHSASGQNYARRDQYFIKSAFSKNGAFIWKGMSFRKPTLTMTGIVSHDRKDQWTYREFTYETRSGRRPTSRMHSVCVIAGEAAGDMPNPHLPHGPQLALWRAEQGASTVNVGGLSLSFTTVNVAGQDPYPQITVRGIGLPTEAIDLKDAEAREGVQYGVLHLDPDHSAKDVLVSGFSGGAHCCSVTIIASLIKGQWQQLPQFSSDGGAIHHAPLDLNHDGTPDFRLSDDAFLYTFASYAESDPPARYFRVDNGHWVDESASPSFRPLYQRDMALLQPDCAKGENGACAAYVAAAARAGRFPAAWRFMLGHFDRASTWDIPDCTPDSHGCSTTTHDYVGALARFLRAEGYIK